LPAILITGSDGLIGKTLQTYLKKNSIPCKEFDISFSNAHANYGDISDKNRIHQQLQDCIGVVHLAAVSRVIWGEKDPERCWHINVNGTQNILEVAYSLPHKPWVIYASSREVYGQQKQFPVKESAILQPLNIYARSKVKAESLVNEYQARGLNTAILRFSSVYGRIDDYFDRVIPAFCRAAVFGNPLNVEGFDNTFDFTHVLDVADGIAKTINLLQRGLRIPSAIHLTTGQPTTLRQVAEFACEITNNKSELLEAPARNFDVARFYGDPNLAYDILNWTSTIDIGHGITQLVNAYQQNICSNNEQSTHIF
jgi:UDP-glucose 4-epimerase